MKVLFSKIFFYCLLIVFIGFLYIFIKEIIFYDRIYPRVYLGEIDVGGLKKNEVKVSEAKIVKEKVKEETKKEKIEAKVVKEKEIEKEKEILKKLVKTNFNANDNKKVEIKEIKSK